ncbi:MAG: signal peptide peptidase SppA [Gammaproteobacteria bacterium]
MENNTRHEDRDPALNGQEIGNRIAREFLAEQRQARRWGIAFKIFIALYLLAFFIIYSAGKFEDVGSASLGGHTALVDVRGIIADTSEANADDVGHGLRQAFEDDNTRGVIIRINSPGGSPVQAGHINDEIRRLKALYPAVPVYAVISDICASGGYYVAVAADHIYADKASLVGSIGVIMAGFGFVDAIEKLGIERRLQHAGENKAMLDPFSPLREEETAHLDTLLDDVYQQFVAVVKQGRGARLAADDDTLFSGLIWSGEQSVALGLVDGLGSPDYVARELIGAEEIIDFTHSDTWLERFAAEVGTAIYNRVEQSSYFQLK